MRFNEINNETALSLKKEIAAGEVPEIVNATRARGMYAWGDLKDLGWAEKDRELIGGTEVEERWIYTGPGAIKLRVSRDKSVIMKKGNATDWTSVDYG